MATRRKADATSVKTRMKKVTMGGNTKKAASPVRKKAATAKAAARSLARKTPKKAPKNALTKQVTKTPKARARTMAAAAPASTVAVTMALEFVGGTPADVMFVRRIAGVERGNGKATLPHGTHTAGWDVVSPTVRPLAFKVKVTEDASGRTALDRSAERTGTDGRGAGADRFTV